MSPTPSTSATSSIGGVKRGKKFASASTGPDANKRMKIYNDEMALRWYSENDVEAKKIGLAIVNNERLRTSYFKGNAGVMKMFRTPFGLRMSDVKIISALDENNKVCISLNTEQYGFYNAIQEEVMGKPMERLKNAFPKWAESEWYNNARISEHSENPYIKTKVQLQGMSRTLGMGAEGVDVVDHADMLKVPGTTIDVKVGISGYFLTATNCGLITSISMYVVKSIPDETEILAEKEKSREEIEAFRAEELRNF